MKLALRHGQDAAGIDNWTIHRSLSEHETNRLQRSLSQLARFQNDYEIYHLVVLAWGNFVEQRNTSSALLAQYMGILHIEKLQLNRVLLNFVATAKAFIDHTAASLSRRYGKESQQLRTFRKATNDAYDSSFAYRLLDKMRNYIVHLRLPISQITSSTRQESPDSAPTNVLSLTFSRDELLQARDVWTSKVREELQALPPELDAFSLCEEYALSLMALGDVRFDVERSSVQDAVNVIDEIEAEVNAPLPIWLCLVPDDFGTRSVGMTIRPIPRGFVASVRSALAANTLQAMLQTAYDNRQLF